VTRVWVDVEDIFAFALHGGRRPTGIQRLAFELCKAIVARYGADGSIRDTITDPAALAAWEQRIISEFHPVAWDDSARALIERLGVAQTASV
jgi:hypothetical protein